MHWGRGSQTLQLPFSSTEPFSILQLFALVSLQCGFKPQAAVPELRGWKTVWTFLTEDYDIILKLPFVLLDIYCHHHTLIWPLFSVISNEIKVTIIFGIFLSENICFCFLLASRGVTSRMRQVMFFSTKTCNTTQQHKQQWREERDAVFLAGNTVKVAAQWSLPSKSHQVVLSREQSHGKDFCRRSSTTQTAKAGLRCKTSKVGESWRTWSGNML